MHRTRGRSSVAPRLQSVSSFDPMGSGLLIEPGLLFTNRHVTANSRRAEIILADGSHILADVVPSSYYGDFFLLSAPSLSGEGWLETAAAVVVADLLFRVGTDVEGGRVRVYTPGRGFLLSAAGKPPAHLHHTAFSCSGNSKWRTGQRRWKAGQDCRVRR